MENQANGAVRIRRIIEHLLDPQVAILWIIGLVLALILYFLGSAVTPFLTAVVVAYILEGPVQQLTRYSMPRWAGIGIVFCLFMTSGLGLIFWLIPLLTKQLTALILELPSIAVELQEVVTSLQAKYGTDWSASYVKDLVPRLTIEIESAARKIVASLVSSLPGLLGVFIYLFLVPLMVLLMLKDKDRIITWIKQFLPVERQLFSRIVGDIDQQMSNLFRGKMWEMLIVSAASVVAFLILDFRFAVLLGLVSGVSVLIPYLGILLATIPIVLVAIFQWGFTSSALPVLISYAVIQLIDGNVLAPMLVGNLIRVHPVALIFAILACGHLWDLGGIILAFPIAIIVKSILDLAIPYIKSRATLHEKEEVPEDSPSSA